MSLLHFLFIYITSLFRAYQKFRYMFLLQILTGELCLFSCNFGIASVFCEFEFQYWITKFIFTIFVYSYFRVRLSSVS